MRHFTRCTQLFKAHSGNVAVMFAIGLPVVVGFCGLGAEAGFWELQHQKLQNAADIAAYAGAVALKTGTKTTAIAAAKDSAGKNGFDPASGTVTVNIPPTSGSHQDNNSVEVLLTRNQSRYFTAIYSSAKVAINTRAVVSNVGANGCILALDPTASKAITISGSANVNAPNCDIVANSNNADALDMSGSAQLTTPCTITVGGVNVTAGLHLNLCSTPTIHAAATPDPYASLATPNPLQAGSCLSVPTLPATLPAGYYCHGLTINGHATFSPGQYYVVGNLSLQGSAVVTGTGVNFYIDSTGTTAISGSASVNLTAPSSGTYAGVLFFGSRAAGTSHNNNISGNTNSTLTGAIYYPTQLITFSGGSSQPNTCTQIIGDKITFSGAAYLGNSCSGVGVQNILPGGASSSTLEE